ncbi:MAG TPA: DNA gyrase modulator, partial [Candidatus Dormibacteraeota bacterium]|nr:DNA gyrase modulator [Candidatus Dormibacteraeota bacterium]
MKDLIERALDAAERAGASYADVRLVERESESLAVKNGALEEAEASQTAGFGVRVLRDGAWGFAASGLMEPDEAERVAREASRIAAASATATRQPVELDGTPPERGEYTTSVREDPFAVSLDEKVQLLLAADAEMGAVPGVSIRESTLEWARERKTFASSAGAMTSQELVECGGGIEATAVNENESQVRSYPQNGGQHVTAGFESMRALDLVGNGRRVGEEAVAL